MSETLRREEIETHCDGLQYPLMRADAAAAFADVTIEEDENETNLGVAISKSDHDSFTNADELYETLISIVETDSVRDDGEHYL